MAIKWKKIVSAVAPTLATALGGPLAGMATKQIAGAILGNENAKEAELEAAITAGGPDMLVKLKELDQQFEIKLRELGLELEKLDVQDRASARAREIAVRDWVPPTLAIGNFVAFCSMLYLMFSRQIPETNRDVFYILLGTLAGNLGAVMTYYFGSSSGSRAKDEILRGKTS